MPTTIVVPVLIALWIAVLAPGIIRRIRDYRTVEGIASYQASLSMLDRRGYDPDISALPPRRPQLVLLRPVDDVEDANDAYVDEESGACFDRVPVRAPVEAAYEPLRQPARNSAALRRRNVLLTLIATTILGLGSGALTGMTMLLAIGGLALVLLVAFVAAAFAVVARQPQQVRYRSSEWYDDEDAWQEEDDASYLADPRWTRASAGR
ncbi:MAG: hypothetical protein WCL38_06965 [Actinomycetota bacterium]